MKSEPRKPRKTAENTSEKRATRKETNTRRTKTEGSDRKYSEKAKEEFEPKSPRKPFAVFSEKRTFGKNNSTIDENKPSNRTKFEDKPSREGSERKPRTSSGDRENTRGPRKEYSPRGEKPTGERRAFGERTAHDGDDRKPRTGFGDRNEKRAPRKEYSPRGEKPTGERRGFGERASHDGDDRKPRTDFGDRSEKRAPRKEYSPRGEKLTGERRGFEETTSRDENKRPERRSTRNDGPKKEYVKRATDSPNFDTRGNGDRPKRSRDYYVRRAEEENAKLRTESDGSDKPFEKKDFRDKPNRFEHDKPKRDKSEKAYERPDRRETDILGNPVGKYEGQRVRREKGDYPQKNYVKRPRKATAAEDIAKSIGTGNKSIDPKSKTKAVIEVPESEGSVRLNRFISNSGVCSRREADELIAAGVVSVNGKFITEMGYQVKSGDKVQYGGVTLNREKKVYLLLNKPKDYITTTDDPKDRKTVMELIKNACKERIYPVGRLDRATTGLLLFTNDGDLAKRLTHPSHGAKKLYHVHLDKNMKLSDMQQIADGIELEDGPVEVDEIVFAGETGDKKELGVLIHSGKNRIVRRIFEHFGYEVIKLDRVIFAGLTKKDLPRGRHRFLTEKELNILKMVK